MAISLKFLKDLTANSNEQTGLRNPKASTNLVDVLLEGTVNEDQQTYFFAAKLIALKKFDGGVGPMAIDNNFRRLSVKSAEHQVFE